LVRDVGQVGGRADAFVHRPHLAQEIGDEVRPVRALLAAHAPKEVLQADGVLLALLVAALDGAAQPAPGLPVEFGHRLAERQEKGPRIPRRPRTGPRIAATELRHAVLLRYGFTLRPGGSPPGPCH